MKPDRWCQCCRVVPVDWSKYSDYCFFCLFNQKILVALYPLAWFFWKVCEFEMPKPEKPEPLPGPTRARLLPERKSKKVEEGVDRTSGIL